MHSPRLLAICLAVLGMTVAISTPAAAGMTPSGTTWTTHVASHHHPDATAGPRYALI
jgi:hypothetical protein